MGMKTSESGSQPKYWTEFWLDDEAVQDQSYWIINISKSHRPGNLNVCMCCKEIYPVDFCSQDQSDALTDKQTNRQSNTAIHVASMAKTHLSSS